jgi:hypothetical protein
METKKFCTQCGAEIPNGSQFCPSCGKKAGTTTQTIATQSVPQPHANTNGQKQSVAIKNNSHFLLDKEMFYLHTLLYYGPILISALIMMASATVGIILFIASLIFAGYIIPAKIMHREAVYDGQNIVLNPGAKIKQFSKKIVVNEIAHIRIRKVNKGYFETRKKILYLQGVAGKYDVIAFDTATQKNALIICFYKKGNMDQFLPILNQALAEHNKDISLIDRNDTLVKIKDFEKE